jgi:hypothetical protein
MPSVQTAYLALVIIGFSIFGLALAWGAWWSNQAATPRRRPTTTLAGSPHRARSAQRA